MRYASVANPVRRIPSFERAHDASAAPVASTSNERARQQRDVLELERESAERVAGKRIESGGKENEVWNEAGSCRIDAALPGVNIV